MPRRARPPRYTAQITMRLYTFPLIALFAIGAQAASLPRHAVAVTDLEKKLTKVVEEVLKKDVQIENHSSEQEPIDEVIAVSEINNYLKRVPGIPVEVVAEEVKPSLKKDYGIEKGDDIDSNNANAASNVKREEVDLKSPGEPQRQEHDTQTPQDSNNEQDTITAIKQSLAETQNAFKQGFEGLATKFQGVFQTNEQLVTIQKSLENLQKSFSSQFEQINNNLQGYFSAEQPAGEPSPDKEASIQEVETKLEVLGEKVQHEVKSLSKVVPELNSVRGSPFHRQDNTNNTAFNPFNGFQQYFSEFQTNIQNYFVQFQNNMQNAINQTQQAGGGASESTNSTAQSDEAATQRPGIWGGIQSSIQSFLSRPPGQQQPQPQGNAQADTPVAPATAAPNRPIVQAIQNNPIYQGVVSLIRPPAPIKAPVIVDVIAEQAQTAENTAALAEGSNSAPDAEKPVESNPEKEDKTPTQTIAPSVGPIQQMVQKNPIVQGITSAVQRIQNTIGGNTDKPRELEIRGYKPGHGGAGDNNDVDGVIVPKCEPETEEKKETPQEPLKSKTEDAEKAPEEKEQTKPLEVPAKTE